MQEPGPKRQELGRVRLRVQVRLSMLANAGAGVASGGIDVET